MATSRGACLLACLLQRLLTSARRNLFGDCCTEYKYNEYQSLSHFFSPFSVLGGLNVSSCIPITRKIPPTATATGGATVPAEDRTSRPTGPFVFDSKWTESGRAAVRDHNMDLGSRTGGTWDTVPFYAFRVV